MATRLEQADIDWLLEHKRAPGEIDSQVNTDWYRIEAKTKGQSSTATVYILDEISPWGSGARAFAEQVAGLDVTTIEMHINSPGGELTEGIAIMNMLRDHKATVNAHIDGLAASAATIVAMGADNIIAKEGSQMMVHEGSGLVYGPQKDMLKMAQLLEKSNAQMAEIYASRAGGTAEQWRAAMGEETWYTAAEAVDAGLADTLDASGKESETVAARKRFDLTVFAHAGRDKAPAPYTPTAGPPENQSEEEDEMPNKILVQMATELGVKDVDKLDTDEKLSTAIGEAQTAAVEAAKVKAKADAEGNSGGGSGGDGGGSGSGDDKPTGTPVKVPPGFMLVDTATVEGLQQAAKRADGVAAKFEERERDAALDAAVAKGKIPNARREHWETYWKTDPEGAKAALKALPDNLVPVTPLGSGGDFDDVEDSDYRALYPEEAK